jgi:enoyl-CoA hydratase/carnithine racemase
MDFSLTRHVADHVGTLTFQREPHNFVSVDLLREIAVHLEILDKDDLCRVVVLRSAGRVFCAGADFGGAAKGEHIDSSAVYSAAARMFATAKPIIASIQGAAIGAGLGLALVADFRIGCLASRFSANFNRIGIHPGFGLSHTLPRLIGAQRAARMFFTGERIAGEMARDIGLIDELVADGETDAAAHALAANIAESSPRAVQCTRRTLRLGLADAVTAAVDRELRIQIPQFRSADFLEGVQAMTERRTPVFTGA